MNQRILELAEQCYEDNSTQIDVNKFAELIVRQCMDLVKDCYAEPGRSLYQSVCASTIIEEHFGIEE